MKLLRFIAALALLAAFAGLGVALLAEVAGPLRAGPITIPKLGSIESMAGMAVMVVIISVSGGFLGWTQRLRCPKCDAFAGQEAGREITSERYKHERTDGSRDRRYKSNASTTNYRVTMQCRRCSATWKRKETL